MTLFTLTFFVLWKDVPIFPFQSTTKILSLGKKKPQKPQNTKLNQGEFKQQAIAKCQSMFQSRRLHSLQTCIYRDQKRRVMNPKAIIRTEALHQSWIFQNYFKYENGKQNKILRPNPRIQIFEKWTRIIYPTWEIPCFLVLLVNFWVCWMTDPGKPDYEAWQYQAECE